MSNQDNDLNEDEFGEQAEEALLAAVRLAGVAVAVHPEVALGLQGNQGTVGEAQLGAAILGADRFPGLDFGALAQGAGTAGGAEGHHVADGEIDPGGGCGRGQARVGGGQGQQQGGGAGGEGDVHGGTCFRNRGGR